MIFALNVLNRFSFLMILANLLSILFGISPVRGVLYPWICLCALIIYYTKKKNSMLGYISSVLSFLPIIKAASIYEGMLLVSLFGYCVYYSYIYIEEVDFNSVISSFKKEYRILLLVIPVALLALGGERVSELAAPYILINLITYTVLLRIVRFLEYNKEDKRVEKINMQFGVAAMLFALILSIDAVRSGLWRSIKLCFNTISLLFIRLVSMIVYIFGDIIEAVIMKLRKLIGERNLNLGQGAPQNTQQEYIDSETVLDFIVGNPVVKTAFNLILIFIIGYIAYRILGRSSRRVKSTEDFIEEKEFISSEKNDNRGGIFKRLLNSMKPKSDAERIRYYYKGFLKSLKSNKVELQESDTSMEVNHKADKLYDKKILDEIREIYILVRYGEHKGDKVSSKRFSELINRGEKNS